MKKTIVIFALCLTPVAACSNAGPRPALNAAASAWADTHLQAGDKLLCAKQVDGESFFVARNGERVKLGYKVVVNDPSSPFSLVAVWRVFNEQGERAIAQVMPVTVTSRVVKDNGKLFSESVEYQTLSGSPKSLRAQAKLKKCSSDQCSPSQPASRGEIEYVVDVCS